MKLRNVLPLAALIVVQFHQVAWAQWPPTAGSRLGEQPYISWWKVLIAYFVFWYWLRCVNWVNQDVQLEGKPVGLSHKVWNPIVALPFVGAMLLVFVIPIFFAGIVVPVFALFLPLTIYIVQRNSRMVEERKVMTGPHLRHWFSNFGRRRKQDLVIKKPHEEGAPVVLEAIAADRQLAQANTIAARQSPAYLTVKQVLADGLDRRAEKVLLDYTRDSVAVRIDVDGVWHPLEGMDRATGDQMLAVMKKLAGVNIAERQQRQQGKFSATYQGARTPLTLTSQGVPTGERVVLELEVKKDNLDTLTDLGMRDKTQQQLRELMAARQGLVLFSAAPGNGLTTLWQASLHSADRLLRDFISIEDKHKPGPVIENVVVEAYDSAAGQTPDLVLPKLLLKQPEVLVFPDLVNAATVNLVCREVTTEERIAFSMVPAKDAAEALARVAALKPDVALLAQAVTGVVNCRLVRRLCTTCRQAFEPPPELLQRLRLPPGRVKQLYRQYQPPPPGSEEAKNAPEVCPDCGGLGYRGRVGIYELLIVDQRLRQVLASQPGNVEALRQAARAGGHRGLQEEGILVVAKGLTSLNELQRVLKA